MPAKIDLTGKVFHRLTVKKEAGRDRYGLAMWECECSCGATVVVRGRDLRTGNSKSCGCLNLEKATKKIQKQTVDHSNPASLASKNYPRKTPVAFVASARPSEERGGQPSDTKGNKFIWENMQKKKTQLPLGKRAKNCMLRQLLKNQN